MMKNTFEIKGTNTAEVLAGGLLVIEEIDSARQQGQLPHTSFFMSNRSSSVEIFVFLDDISNQDAPDYVLFPKQSMNLHVDEGETFQQIIIKNNDGATALAINELKYKIATVKEV